MTSNSSVCGCCDGLSLQTPVEIYNRPGLSEIAYRVGKQPQFKASLLTRVSGSKGELSALTTREDNDFTIALLDSWAVISDILTFYQERIANETYLRTATERFSVLEMARMIGYELSPGVAASTYLCFTIEDTHGALSPSLSTLKSFEDQETTPPVTLDPGLKVQSIPGQNEHAQVFETIETIEARAEWNAMAPKTSTPTIVSELTEVFYLDGLDENIKAGDVVLLNVDDLFYPRQVLEVERNNDNKYTLVKLQVDIELIATIVGTTTMETGDRSDFDSVTVFTEKVAQQIFNSSWKAEDLSLLIESKNWSEKDLVKARENYINDLIQQKIDIYRQHAFVFGYNAPKIVTYNLSHEMNDPSQWTELELTNELPTKLYLDKIYEGITPGSVILVQDQGTPIEDSIQIEVVSSQSTIRTDYGISSPTSLLTLADGSDWYPDCDSDPKTLSCLRNKIIHVLTDPLTLTEEPVDQDVSGSEIILDGIYFGLKSGKKIMVTGKRADLTSVIESELATIKQVYMEKGYTRLVLKQALELSYVRDSVLVNANVALATHGESVTEILGSGDASVPFQKFTLKQTPLTYIQSDKPGGTKTTLEVRVNDILWTLVPFFTGHDPDERIYTVRLSDDGYTTVAFGDGITGSRLPTGKDNVKANYRKGTGTDGLLDAYRLTQLMSRPLGVKAVENLLATEGAANAEKLTDARKNAPLTVMTMDRVVTLQDYEDYSRAFTGIDKALATWVWKNQKRWVHITIAGTDGAVVTSESDTHKNLVKSLRNYGNPRVPILVDSFNPRYFKIEFSIEVSPGFIPEDVSSAVEEKLQDAFSFDNREFGQPVWKSEVITMIQQVDGVIYVDLNALYFSENESSLEDVLPASLPHYDNNQFFGADLIMIAPQSVNPVIIS